MQQIFWITLKNLLRQHLYIWPFAANEQNSLVGAPWPCKGSGVLPAQVCCVLDRFHHQVAGHCYGDQCNNKKNVEIRGNISHTVMCSKYPGLSPMELVAHLEVRIVGSKSRWLQFLFVQALSVANWSCLRPTDSLLLLTGAVHPQWDQTLLSDNLFRQRRPSPSVRPRMWSLDWGPRYFGICS